MLWRNLMARYQAPAEGDGGGSGGEGGQGDGGSGTGAGEQGASGNRSTLLGGGGNQGAGAGAGGQGSGEGAAGAGESGAGGEGTGTTDWYWTEGNQGEGERPPWLLEKFKSVSEQARSFSELEKKVGTAAELIGAPEAGTYEIPAPPEGLAGEFDPEDPLLSGFQKVAGELNLSQKAHDKIVQYMGGVIAEQNAADEKKLADALGALGENVDARVTAVDQYLQKTVGQEGYDALQAAIGNDAAAFRALEVIVGKASGDAQLAGGTGVGGPAITRADVEAEQFKVFPEGHPMAGKKMYDHDKEHRARVDRMWKQLYPGQDRTQVG